MDRLKAVPTNHKLNQLWGCIPIFNMAIKRKNGYKFSETALGAFLDGEKEREGKFRLLGWIFAVLLVAPMLFLVLALVWQGVKWVLSLVA